jgi:hypothetical protein
VAKGRFTGDEVNRVKELSFERVADKILFRGITGEILLEYTIERYLLWYVVSAQK